MIHSVAIIGSFQKYYDDILEIIRLFKKNGIYVSSPKESYIDGRVDDFVLFESDNKDFSPEEIQMVTLNKIISADCVYVYNPNGYVGKTTCYEIGFCLAKKKSVFFYEHPSDLPIPISKKQQVFDPQSFIDYAFNNDINFINNYEMCFEAEKAFEMLFDIEKENSVKQRTKRIVICGSMAFYDDMMRCQEDLKLMGIDSIIPKEENESISYYSDEQFTEFKRRVSRTYLKKIRDKDTVGVLIYNAEKRGIANYIGPNTLVELAMAFTWNRKIFLYNDIYIPLIDELKAWDCISINGDLTKIKKELNKENKVLVPQNELQISLF